MIHAIKIQSRYYEDIVFERKTFEVRRNDRDYRVGDMLALNEVDEDGQYTGRHVLRSIVYILADKGYVLPGYVVLGIANDSRAECGHFCSDKRSAAPDIPRAPKIHDRMLISEDNMKLLISICQRQKCSLCPLSAIGCYMTTKGHGAFIHDLFYTGEGDSCDKADGCADKASETR